MPEVLAENERVSITSQKDYEEELIRAILYDDWEQVLIMLVQDMDPWDIDIVKLSDRFTTILQKMRDENLRIPARIILAASIIYRMKCEALMGVEAEGKADEQTQQEQQGTEEQAQLGGGQQVVIPPLRLPIRREFKRRITLEELVEALNKAMKVKKRRELRHFMVNLELNQKDFSEHIEKIYERILQLLYPSGVVFFSELVKSKTKEEIIRDFASLLHLIRDEKIVCEQPVLFGEILIKPKNQ